MRTPRCLWPSCVLLSTVVQYQDSTPRLLCGRRSGATREGRTGNTRCRYGAGTEAGTETGTETGTEGQRQHANVRSGLVAQSRGHWAWVVGWARFSPTTICTTNPLVRYKTGTVYLALYSTVCSDGCDGSGRAPPPIIRPNVRQFDLASPHPTYDAPPDSRNRVCSSFSLSTPAQRRVPAKGKTS
jgi:hypothetical protein